LETSFKSANFEKDGLFVIYRIKFVGDDIGSNMVSTIFNYKAADSVVYIDHSKNIHKEVGLVTQRRLAIILKIRSSMMAFFFDIIEDSDLPPIIGIDLREQRERPASFLDFDLTDEQVYVTSLKVLKCQGKGFHFFVFCKVTYSLRGFEKTSCLNRAWFVR
jgi:hypothetical protein